MTNREQLRVEIEEIPEQLIGEVLDFVRFVKQRAAVETIELALMSESALGKDWLKPEEDNAWRDL